ncbi:uncharacterized protein LOC133996801 [Scomber scombrus]|uniref:uncharacterized protein LOC133996801 n=1 Tax=Scomber scombrus TaxID=13677 RepID=UPI002DDBFAD7|nr:uncharacterized protein LOC133996801 [Scomber scombrus]
MGKRKDLGKFDKGQIVMARRLGQRISKTAALVGCSRSAVVTIYQKWSKEGTVVTGHRVIDARGERRLARVVRSNSRTPVRVPMLSPVHRRKRQQWAREHQNWTTEQWKKVAWIMRRATKQKWFRNSLRTWPPNSPDLNSIEHLWDVLDKQVRSMEATPRNLQDLKDLLLTSWCQIPQHTFRGLVESMPQQLSQHTLKFDYTASYGVKNIPDVVVVGFIDEVPVGHCDSIGKKVESKLDWAQKLIDDDPEHFKWYTGRCLSALQEYKALIDNNKESGAVHVFQRIDSCEWDNETGEVNGFTQFGQDGEDFLAFDPQTLTWIAQKPEAESTKHYMDSDRHRNEKWKNILTKLLPEFLKRYLDLGKSHLLRTDLPSVSLLQKTPSSPVSCFATGFYPDRAEIFWRKDGEELHENVELGEILPNHDGSFQMNVDLNLSSVTPEDWRKYECVFQLSGVKDDIITKLDKTVIKTNFVPPSDSPAGPVIGAVVVLLLLLAVCITGVFIWRRRKNARSTLAYFTLLTSLCDAGRTNPSTPDADSNTVDNAGLHGGVPPVEGSVPAVIGGCVCGLQQMGASVCVRGKRRKTAYQHGQPEMLQSYSR